MISVSSSAAQNLPWPVSVWIDRCGLLIVLMEKEKKVRQDRCMGKGNYSNRASLWMHKDSQTISKSSSQPKIRIIHIFAPEIIKTDAGNFRELVQRLTGKPTAEKHGNQQKPRLIAAAARDHEDTATRRSTNIGPAHHKPKTNNKMELRKSNELSRERLLMKQEEVGLCSNNDDSGGYLGGFSDLEGFISELAQFPLLPLDLDDTLSDLDQALERQPHHL